MRLLLAAVTALLVAAPTARAGTQATMLPALEDLSLPFACDWGYDWDERCYWDDLDRLHVGGVGDKVWRAALRFPVEGIPTDAVVVTAELTVSFDGWCAAPRATVERCDGRPFALEARPILTAPWRSEREVAVGPVAGFAEIAPFAAPGPVVWDVTDLVAEWHGGGLRNDGMLLKLADGDEALDAGGPSFPDSTHAAAELRPRLTVWYVRTS